jgi:hypothetical protein
MGSMSVQIPVPNRAKLLAPARQRLLVSADWPLSVVPTTAEGWSLSLIDAGLSATDQLLFRQFDGLLDPDNLVDAGRLRESSIQLSESVAGLAENLSCLASLSPPGSAEAWDLRHTLVAAAQASFDHLCGEADRDDVIRCKEAADEALRRLRSVADIHVFPADACEAAFGVPYEQLLDGNRIFSPPRLLSAYYGKYGELTRRIGSVLSAITRDPPDLLNAVAPAEALVLMTHPLVALRTARRVGDLIREAFEADPDRTATILRKHKLEADRSAASHAAMVRLLRHIDHAESEAESAQMKLDLYRRMVESQLRPWAWVLLQIVGRNSSKIPELSSLRDQLVSEGTPLLLEVASTILPEARNASAHEDYLWDEDLAKLRVGEAVVSIEDLEDATDLAYTFMAAAECAWRCSRTTLPELARRLDVEDPPSGLRAIRERTALDHFGTNGLSLRRWTHENRCLTVVLDDLPQRSVDPCFQATIWVSRHLESVERVIVKVGDGALTPALHAVI